MESSNNINNTNCEENNTFKIKTSNRKYEDFSEDLESKWNGSFRFIQAADTQLGLIDRYVYKKNEITWTKEIYYLRLTINSINKMQPLPRFFVICGDLVDSFPAWKQMRSEQVKDLKTVLSELDSRVKLVCVCGNHDVGDEPTVESIDQYRSEFGDDYFSFWTNGCKFITLNSQLYFNSKQVAHLRQKQDQWLDNELGLNPNQPPASTRPWKHLFVFQHIPLFIKNEAEPAHVYFNIEPNQRANLLDRFKRAGVGKVFCGHYHQNAGGFTDDGKIEVVVTSAIGAQLGNDKHGFRIVDVHEDRVKHEYVAVTDQVN